MKCTYCLLAAGLVLLVVMVGCAAPLGEDTATAVIAINGLTGSGSSAGDGLLGAAPTGIQGVSVLVEGPGMTTLGAYYPGAPGSLELVVPAGSRTFTVTVYLDPALDSPVLAFGGKTTVTLAAGSSETVNVDMSVYESKLVVPDYNNSRVVQFDDMNGGGWAEAAFNQTSDVAFDRYGKFYVTRENGFIDVFSSISQAPTSFNTYSFSPVETLTIDTRLDMIYYYDGDNNYIRRRSFDGLVNAANSITNIKGMEYDAQTGFLYLVENNNEDINDVLLYDFDSATVVKSYNLFSFVGEEGGYVWDVTIMGDYVYVIMYQSAEYQIIRLSRDLTNPVGYGSQGVDGSKGKFFGPAKFVGRSQYRLYIIDENSTSGEHDQIISIQDIFGKGWKTFGSSGSLEGEFAFFIVG